MESQALSVQNFIAIVSGITGLVTALGVLVVNIMQNRKTSYEHGFRLDNIDKKLVVIDEKIDEHNGYAKRFEEIEKYQVAMQKDISYMKQMFDQFKDDLKYMRGKMEGGAK